MKTLILNGSPRKGNTFTAVETLSKEISADCEIIQLNDLNIKTCQACAVCKDNGGTCVFDDDSKELMRKIKETDFLIIATPVYFWGMSAQVKLALDKFYQCSAAFKEMNKKMGLVVTGAGNMENIQYRLIREQFECIAKHLNWDLEFYKAYSGSGLDDLKDNDKAIDELKALGKSL